MFNIDEIYSVSDFLSLCNTTLENHIPTCWLQGEISNLSRPTSGHWYFSLKDKRGQIRCALFRLSQRHLKFNPENGMEVLLRAAPTLYEARGDFQLIVQHLEPVGVGNLQLAFDQLKNTLQDEGLFEALHKKPLPLKVNTLGVISSSNGAVIQDIIKVLNPRYPFAQVRLFDTVVQGEGAADKIAYALKMADKSGQCDVLIIARGGGSLEDLWAFNEEVLARAIFAAKTPIISAIGHETDTTIADFVADLRAPTPSAAAMLATPDRLALLNTVNKLHASLIQLSQHTLNRHQSRLRQLGLNPANLTRQLNVCAQQLDGLNAHLQYQINTVLGLNKNKVSALFEQLKQHSPSANITHNQQLNRWAKIRLKHGIQQRVRQQKNTLKSIHQRLHQSINATLEQQKNALARPILGLNHLSPLKTLSRGYSISKFNKNQVAHSVADVKIGTILTTLLGDGKIYSTVEKIEKN